MVGLAEKRVLFAFLTSAYSYFIVNKISIKLSQKVIIICQQSSAYESQ